MSQSSRNHQRRMERHRSRYDSTPEEELTFESFDPFQGEPMTITVMDDALDDDAAVAQALQDEYEAEYRRSQYQMHQNLSSNVALAEVVVPGTVVRAPRQQQQQQQQEDEALARRLEREPSRTELAPYLKRSTTAVTARSSSSDGGSNTTNNNNAAVAMDDESLARRVEQEFGDEDLAFAISQQEMQRASRQRAANLQARQSRQPARRLGCVLLPIFFVAAAVGSLLYFFVLGDEGMPRWMPSPEEFAEEDPFSQRSPDDVNKWRTGNNGLELDVLNALQDEWFPYFYTAVNDWDSGLPDAVDLQTRRVDVDTLCKTVPRVLKVCNGDYGETAWRGINKLLLEDQDIYASAARMNEFYFQGDDPDQRQYTMCHEIGHGLGLPHTDESFTNPDLGNCMDYTNRPEVNRQPDESNYIFLAQLYGTIPGTPPYVPEVQEEDPEGGTEVPEEDIVMQANAEDEEPEDEEDTPEEEEEDEKDKDKRDKGDRRLRSGAAATNRRLLRFMDDVDQEIERGLEAIGEHTGWKLLHRSAYGEAHEKRLDDRYRVQLHFLLA